MKLNFKGFLRKVHSLETVGEKETLKQVIMIEKPSAVDAFGEPYGPPDHFEITVFNEKVKEADLNALIDKKVDVFAYLNTFEYDEKIDGQKTGEKRYGMGLNLISIQEHLPKPVQ